MANEVKGRRRVTLQLPELVIEHLVEMCDRQAIHETYSDLVTRLIEHAYANGGNVPFLSAKQQEAIHGRLNQARKPDSE